MRAPPACIVCSAPLPPDVHVFCADCWSLVPQPDRQQMVRMHRANPDRTGCWISKAEKIARGVRALRGLPEEPKP